MKSVCRFCNNSVLIRWGKRRRQCQKCKRTFRVTKAGRKKEKITKMYLLDRSTYRRIGSKEKLTHADVIHALKGELKQLPIVLSFLKKIFIDVATSWLWMVNTFQLRVRSIVSI